MDDYLSARPITSPFGLYDCDVPCDASIAVVVSDASAAAALPRPAVLVEAVGTQITERISWDQDTVTHEPQVLGQSAHLWTRTDLRPADVDVAMVAPKAPGHTVRWQYEAGQGTPVLVAVAQDATGKAWNLVRSYAKAIGGTKAGALVTTFKEETESDLFGEQAVLCGGASELVIAGFETLVEAGYQPEIAYYEVMHELKLIVDLIYEGGFARMHQFVSETAKYGDLSRGSRVVDEHAREEMRKILAEIRSGEFAKEWIGEHAAGRPRYNALLKSDLEHPIEQIGAKLRERMAWLRQKAVSA